MQTTPQNISETSLNRLFDKHYPDGFIIITSYRGDKTKEENNKTFEELKATIKGAKYSFIPVYGGFIENLVTDQETTVYEPALLVPNHIIGSVNTYDNSEALKTLGLELCKKYNQYSILYKTKVDKNEAFYIDKEGNVDYTFTNKTINDLTQQYFTKLNKDQVAKTDKRFTFTEEVYLSTSPKDTNEARKRHGEHFYNVKDNKQVTLNEGFTIVRVVQKESILKKMLKHLLREKIENKNRKTL